MKDFDDFQPNISMEAFSEIIGSDNHSFGLTPKIVDGELQLDMNQLAAYIVSTSVLMSKEILRQYHDWINAD